MIEALQASPSFLFICSVTLALLVGSFLNVVIHRVPMMMYRSWQEEVDEWNAQEEKPAIPEGKFNLVVPNSHCPHCDHQIKPWENIPVVSYLLLKGKCSNCKKGISPRYPLIEFISGLLVAIVVWKFGFSWQLGASMIFTWALITLTMIDADHMLLPDSIVMPLLWLGLICNYFALFTSFESAFIGAIAGYLSLWAFYWIFYFATGKQGMGFGDFKLFAALGAWLGWEMLLPIIILSSLVGALIGIAMTMFGNKDKQKPIPFGPYLAISGWIALVWGETIVNQYFQFFKL